MNILIYRNAGTGATATLTSDSPQSNYGRPVLRISGPGVDNLPDLGPADTLPSGLTAAELVVSVFDGAPREGQTLFSREDRDAARSFLEQWKEGPQLQAEDE